MKDAGLSIVQTANEAAAARCRRSPQPTISLRFIGLSR